MHNHWLISSTAVLVSVGAGAALYLSTQGGWPPRLNPTLPQTVGQELAKLALQAAQPKSPITVITRNTTAYPNPALDFQLAGFNQVLRKAKASPPVMHTLQVDPLRPVEVPSGDFFELIRNAPTGSVLVSFMGPPVLTAKHQQMLRQIKPSVIAFSLGNAAEQVDWRSLFHTGLLRAAVVGRRSPALAGIRPADGPGLFRTSFLVLTAANVDSLTTPAGKLSESAP
jgi:hypothetical protein